MLSLLLSCRSPFYQIGEWSMKQGPLMLIWRPPIAFRKHASLCAIHSYHSIYEGYKTAASVAFIIAIIYVCIFYNFSKQNDARSGNHLSWTKLILRPPIVNTIGVYGMTTQGARASATMKLPKFSGSIPVSTPDEFNFFLDALSEYLDKSKGIKVGTITVCHMLFADDLILASETPSGLQKLINGLEEFC